MWGKLPDLHLGLHGASGSLTGALRPARGANLGLSSVGNSIRIILIPFPGQTPSIWTAFREDHNRTLDLSQITHNSRDVLRLRFVFGWTPCSSSSLPSLVLRQISGLRKSTPHCIVFHETEEKPLHHYWLLRTVKFWNNLLQLAPDSIFRGVLLSLVLSAETFSEGWFFDFLQALRSIGYGPLPCLGDLTAVVEYDVQCLLMQSLNKPFTPALQSIVPRQLFTPGIVLCTYFHWFRPPARKFASCSPISLPLPAKLVRTFLRFRSGCSGLPIDTGRVTRIPRAARVCLACLSGSLCDEQHLVFDCPALASLRHQYTCLFRPGTVTMQTFLWQKDIVLVAKFVFEAMAILTGNLWSCMLGNCLGYSLLKFRTCDLVISSAWCGWHDVTTSSSSHTYRWYSWCHSQTGILSQRGVVVSTGPLLLGDGLTDGLFMCLWPIQIADESLWDSRLVLWDSLSEAVTWEDGFLVQRLLMRLLMRHPTPASESLMLGMGLVKYCPRII